MWLTLLIRNRRVVALGCAALACLAAGIWFRGVLAENDKLTVQNGAQAAELKEVIGEVERMNVRDALDQTIFEQLEQQKIQYADDLRRQGAALRAARKLLDDATQDCLSRPLPTGYLDRLPVAGDSLSP